MVFRSSGTEVDRKLIKIRPKNGSKKGDFKQNGAYFEEKNENEGQVLGIFLYQFIFIFLRLRLFIRRFISLFIQWLHVIFIFTSS